MLLFVNGNIGWCSKLNTLFSFIIFDVIIFCRGFFSLFHSVCVKAEMEIQWRQTHSNEIHCWRRIDQIDDDQNVRWFEIRHSFRFIFLQISTTPNFLYIIEMNIFVFFFLGLCAEMCMGQAGKQNNCAMSVLAGNRTKRCGSQNEDFFYFGAFVTNSRPNLIKNRQYLITLRFRKAHSILSPNCVCVFFSNFAFSLGEIPFQLSKCRKKSKCARILRKDSFKVNFALIAAFV